MRMWQHKNGTYYVTFDRGQHRSPENKERGKGEKDTVAELEREMLKGKLVLLEKGEQVLFNEFKEEYFAARLDKSKSTRRADRLAMEKFGEVLSAISR